MIKKVNEYSDEQLIEAQMKYGSELSKVAKKLGISKRELSIRLTEMTLKERRIKYDYDKETWEALTCPHCGKVAPPIEIDDPTEYLCGAYGGKVDSKVMAGVAIFARCCHCGKGLKLVYTLLEMRPSPPEDASVAEALARRLVEKEKERKRNK